MKLSENIKNVNSSLEEIKNSKFSITNCKNTTGIEGQGFLCKVKVNNQTIHSFENYGDGGCSNIFFEKNLCPKIIEEYKSFIKSWLLKYCETTEFTNNGGSFYRKYTENDFNNITDDNLIEQFILNYADDKDFMNKINRQTKNKTLIIKSHEDDINHKYNIISHVFDEKVKTYLKTNQPNTIIINEILGKEILP